ncbi:hypothetical protein [Nocardioides mangrovi]|uniref:Delta-60 repeat domain-containing protein n=1 Tax=Nocardioides mangrovi TaxID=2874580 RepID=A0ABS7UFY8_9ACTN|nr:hypothetical protein [Nocardioides mangrovi]MBZ5739739.1 hypothetical protein [Nocardioides mangrovi]
MSRARTWVGVLAALASAATLTLVVPGPATAQLASPTAASWAWGVNGPVYAVATSGDKLIVGGAFSKAVGRNGATLPRRNLAAFSLRTGRPLKGWVANTDGTVFALNTSKSSVWVGGAFEVIGGSGQEHVAKLSLSNGAVSPGFVLDTNGAVRAFARQGNRLFAGGDFTSAQEEPHAHVVAVDATTGATDPAFTAATDGTVRALALKGARLYVGGNFTTIDDRLRTGMGSVDPMSGAVSTQIFRYPNASRTTPALVNAIDVSSDGRVVAAMGGKPINGNQAVGWGPSAGKAAWRVHFAGDAQAVRLAGGTAYVGIHGKYKGNGSLHLLAIDARTGKVSSTFRPAFTGFWGVRSIAVSSRGIVAGGQFSKVDQKRRNRVAFFPFGTKG